MPSGERDRGARLRSLAGLGLLALILPLASCGGGHGATVKPPACSPSVASLAFGNIPLGSFKDTTFTITNVGQGTLAGTVTSPCPDYTIQGTAAYNLGAGAQAVVAVRFTPSQAGPRPCALSLAGGCSPINCTGTGVSPCQESPAALDFGVVALGQSADSSFTITNTGNRTLSGTVTAPCADYTIVGSASYSLVGPGSQKITVRFTPSQTGARPCVLDVGAGCSSVSCTGTGVSPCQVSPAALDFGVVSVGQNSDLGFTITNTGNGTLAGTVTSPCADYTIVGSASYDLVGPGSQMITVRFTPSVSGASACTIDTGNPGCPGVTCNGSGGLELDSPTLGSGAVYRHTFAVAGTYNYHCNIHSFMHGTVIVSAGGPASVAVSIQGFSFSPSSVTVGPGGTVTWTNNDGTAHTVTSD